MHKPELCLFRHPTTTVFVDDNDDFLYSIALGVDQLPYRSFSSPAKGLDYVNTFAGSYEIASEDHLPSRSLSVSKLFASVGNKLNDQRRFAEPSVLVVDYSMPSMTGLDLCAQITNPNIKKVLLTGVADERLAIEALNIELIDFYISKREKGLAQRLRGVIAHLETRYFQDLYAWSRDGEVRNVLPQLFDTDFADYFEEVIERLGIVEHYPVIESPVIERPLIESPVIDRPVTESPRMDSAFISNCGFRLIDGYGHCKRLQVFDDVQINEFLRNADLSALSPASRTKLERRELIPQRITDGGTLTENQLLTPTVIDGARRWYCALYNDGSLSDGSLSAISYQQFLKTFHSFDEQVYVGS